MTTEMFYASDDRRPNVRRLFLQRGQSLPLVKSALSSLPACLSILQQMHYFYSASCGALHIVV